ncbi:hypothetical protein BWR19_14685 [Halomonas sp. 1513]|nr:c-type cytochrome [Halomonas sp. 1513]APX94079.1 hypothetical protein BWR19_14685 [Halomonas sp. 1513]
MNVRLPRAAMAALGACLLLGASHSALADGYDLQLEVMAGGCANCHGTDGARAGSVPPLAGRDADYLEERLLAFKRDEVADTTIMNRIAKGFSDDELTRLAEHFANVEQE